MNPILEGWKCPSCYTIYAPFVRSCNCVVNRAHDPAGQMTTNDGVSNNEVMDAWQKQRAAGRPNVTTNDELARKQVEDAWKRLDAAIASKTAPADQWTPAQ